MKKLLGYLLALLLLLPVSVFAIPSLGVAPGAPGDTGLDTASYDGFPMPLNGGSLTIWYGNDSGSALDLSSNIWLLTTSANGGSFTFTPEGGSALTFSLSSLSVASYKDPVYGTNLGSLGDPITWDPLNETFYSYEFGGKNFWYLNGDLDTGPSGAELGDWMYAVLDNDGKILGGEFSPKTTSSYGAPEPATMLLLGSGLIGLAGLGRKKFKK